MSHDCRLSVVVAVTDARDPARAPVASTAPRSAPPWLAALIREANAIEGSSEILLVGDLDATAWEMVGAPLQGGTHLRVLTAPPTALAPELWGIGLVAARGKAVAFTINQCVVQTGWAQAALGGLGAGDAGVGGRIGLGDDASSTGRAIYFLRYSAFLSADDGRRHEVREIAGDNAAYDRALLMRYDTYAHGFWEVEPHHRMRADGRQLARIPGMVAVFGGAPRLRSYIRQRFAHGRHFGGWRVRVGGRRPWQIVLASPLVPFVLLLRTAKRVSGTPGGLLGLSRCVAPFFALAAAWSAGEAAGALGARR
jgi:hypothetical protein